MSARAVLLLVSVVVGQVRPEDAARAADRMGAVPAAKVVAKLKGQPASSVTVHLRSGRDVSGLVVDVTESAVLLRTPKSRAGDFSLSWLELAAIEGVTLPDGAAAAASTALGQPPAPATRLDVERRAAELAKQLAVPVEAGLKNVADDGLARRVLIDALDACAAALKQVSAEEVGRKEVQRSLKGVRVVEAGRARAQLSNGTLSIEVASAKAEYPNPDAIKAVLESSL